MLVTRKQRKSLILVHPPQQGLLEGFSAGLIALANFIQRRAEDVEVTLLDLGTAGPEAATTAVRDALRRASEPVFVGISATTASYFEALRTARLFKSLAPHAVVVLGGHHASSQDDVILERHHGAIDVVVRGEGEYALLGLVQRFPEFAAVPGISFWRDGAVERNSPAPLLDPMELDGLGVTFRGGGIRSAPGKFDHITYVSARGCPLACHFCAVASEAVRSKSVPAVIADLRHLVGDLDFTSIAIEDNFFAQNAARTIALCGAIGGLQRELSSSFRWDCQTRVESMVNADVVRAMERAGCEAVYLGVEALTEEHLAYLGKTRNPSRYLKLLADDVVPKLVRSDIDCYINLQLGIPGERPEHLDATLRRLARLGAIALRSRKTITVFPQLHVLYPGTHHFATAVNANRFGPNTSRVFEPFTEWEAAQEPVRTWLGEHFAHGTGGIPEGILAPEPLRRGEFRVEPDAVLRVANALTAIERVPGISVFHYGAFLASVGTADARSALAG